MHNVWFQYAALSNELVTPTVLADPVDSRARRAVSWDNSPNGGLANATYQNRAVSYWLALHATGELPMTLISGDYNIQTAGRETCSSGIQNASMMTASAVLWTNSNHGQFGNLAFMDGHVEQSDQANLKRAVEWNNNWNTHMLY